MNDVVFVIFTHSVRTKGLTGMLERVELRARSDDEFISQRNGETQDV